ncbi:GyrI-like domain-containing protein [Pseudodesulfovibrio sp. zrk46]|uniref:MerR family transcriptional regulator n=1 Tax=Pseudodesulfovibrio sp. zrk46 TaxID=2725288 RepID=UPI00144A1B92|nr:GyrI-like domain-containing protein [Pseudodesulfovibrio sp. zrk46]QJB57080.1 MerR family DNA-binding transcriptional regulator [Pseudodesulfovibrio sp. zrk46]
MKPKGQIFIGDMSKICNISKKALRYYDEIGLIPSQRHDYNNYRYYTYESQLCVPVIKYYKQMGFTLDEMKEYIEGNTTNVYRSLQRSFQAKAEELEEQQEAIRRKQVAIMDWSHLIQEAENVIDHDVTEPSVKYVEASQLLFMDQTFEDDMRGSIINIEFTNYVESLGNEITGPVLINFSSISDRVEGLDQPVKILQKTLIPTKPEHTYTMGGKTMLSCYHIGNHEDLGETYEKMRRWARQHQYNVSEESFERYVTDYWTTNNSAKHVTEILIEVSRANVNN